MGPRTGRCYILFLGGSVRGPHDWGAEVHPRFPLGKAQDQFSLFLPVFVNAGISHPCSIWILGSFLPLYCPCPTLCLSFGCGDRVFGCVCVCVCTRVRVQCQASQNLQREEAEDSIHKDVCKGLLGWALSVCVLRGLAFCTIHAPLSHLALPNTFSASLTSGKIVRARGKTRAPPGPLGGNASCVLVPSGVASCLFCLP